MTIHLLHGDHERARAALVALTDSLDASSAVLDETGTIVAFTAGWHAYAGANPFLAGQGLGASYLDLCRGLSTSPDGNLSIVALGLLGLMEGRLPRVTFDFPFHEADGPHDFGLTGVACSPAHGVRAVVHLRDITHRAAMERRMRRAERLFKATNDNAMDFICLLDAGSRMAYHNPALQAFLGPQVACGPDCRMADFVHAEDQATFMAALSRGSESGRSHVFEYRLADAHGHWADVEGQVSAVEDPGGHADSVVLISRDISFRKQLEREREQAEIQVRHSQKLEAIGQLAAGIAHEINTPTQYIGDNTTFLRDAFREAMELIRTLQTHLAQIQQGEGEGGKAQEALAALEACDVAYLEEEIPKAIQQTLEGVGRVSAIVGAMKDFSHPGSESLTSVDLHRAIESTLTVSRGEWKSVATVETDFAPDLPLVPCFPGEINQVILNLVVNAAHAIAGRIEAHGGANPGLIRVGTRNHGTEVEIWVSDDGTGIPEAIQHRIFEPFFTTKAVGKGSGQGLAIVHGVITEKHKGRITLESTLGQGTTFRVYLPLDAAQH